MTMISENTKTIGDMLHNFALDELIDSYYTGELEIFLRRIDCIAAADSVAALNTHNAFLLIELYKILGLNPEMTEEQIRLSF